MIMRHSRLAPLTGIVYAVLTLVAFATASGAPTSSASGAKVIALPLFGLWAAVVGIVVFRRTGPATA